MTKAYTKAISEAIQTGKSQTVELEITSYDRQIPGGWVSPNYVSDACHEIEELMFGFAYDGLKGWEQEGDLYATIQEAFDENQITGLSLEEQLDSPIALIYRSRTVYFNSDIGDSEEEINETSVVAILQWKMIE